MDMKIFEVESLPVLVSICLSFSVVLVLIIRSSSRTRSKQRKLPPSPPKLPIIGNLHQISELLHRSLHELSKRHGPVMFLKLGSVPTVVVSSPEGASEVMKTYDIIFANRPPLRGPPKELFEGDMAFAPYGEYYSMVRKLCVGHLLSPKVIQSFRLVREDAVTSMIEDVSVACSAGTVMNVREVVKSFACHLLSRIFLGETSREKGIKMLGELVGVNAEILQAFNVADFFPWLAWMDVFLRQGAKVKLVAAKWHKLLDSIIEEHKGREINSNDDFVSILLSLQRNGSDAEFKFSHETMRMLLQDLIGAGADTTYMTIEWGMTELVRNPDVMKTLQAEVREIAGDKPMVMEEDLRSMTYLRLFLKETLRLHSPAPLLIPRYSTEKCQVLGYEIPKGTRILVNEWAITRDPELWEAPEQFKPERFIDIPADLRGQNFQYTPFGAGRRTCPGIHFAISAVEVALANLVHRFNWSLPDNVSPQDVDMMEAPGIVTPKKECLYLIAKPRLLKKSVT